MPNDGVWLVVGDAKIARPRPAVNVIPVWPHVVHRGSRQTTGVNNSASPVIPGAADFTRRIRYIPSPTAPIVSVSYPLLRSSLSPSISRSSSKHQQSMPLRKRSQRNSAHMPSSLSHMKDRVRNKFGDSLSPDDAYLSYHDVRLVRADVDSIKYNDWLTDNAIAFWEEYLEREELAAFPRAQIVLLRPSMSFMLMLTPDPLTLKDALPDFSNTTHIFLPINDNRDVNQAEGGSHWSLLLVSIIDGVSFHYDSLAPSNDQDARFTSAKLEQLLGKRLRFIHMDDAPQQENGSDCGVFVCMLMKHLLLKRLLRADASKKISMSMADQKVNASDARKTMLKTIDERRKEGERRRSRSASPFGRKSTSSKSPPRIGAENDSLKS